MEQSVSRVSRVGRIAKVATAALIGLAGLTVVGVQQAGAAAPVVSSVTPNSGIADGGTNVTIAGSGFGTVGSVSGVTFNGAPATNVVQKSGIKILATAPFALNATSPVDVQVTTSGVTTAPNPPSDSFTYTWSTAPTVTSINPQLGSSLGGTSVTITGTHLAGASAVHFGGTTATSFTVTSATTITAVAPAGTGSADVTVTTPNSTSATNGGDVYTYVSAPVVSGLRTVASPAGGPTGGGTQVTIDGTSFTSDATVAFGGTPATSVLVNSLSSITAVAPAGTGTVDVTVHTAQGTSATTSADQFTYSSTLALSAGTAGYSSGTSTSSGVAATGTSQSGSTVTVTTPGVWTPGEEVYLSGFTNGLASGFYTVTVGGTGSFGITYAPSLPLSSSGTIVPSQVNSFNAESLLTGGGTIDPGTLTVVTQPASGTVSAAAGQLLYIPARATPTSSGAPVVWTQDVTTTGTQTVTFAVCETGHTWTGNPSTGCAEGTVDYVPSSSGYYMGQQISALNGALQVSVVVDTSGSVVAPASAATGSTFTSITAAPMSLLPSSNSGYAVLGVGGYQAITPVPTGLTLVPGSLHVSGGDSATAGKYIASYCTAAMGFVPGECTANMTGNYHATYPYIETSLNSATSIPGGTEITLPTVTAQWQVTAASGATVSSYETEFTVSTNVAQPVGPTTVDAYPSDLASFNNQGTSAPAPTYAAPAPRWTVNVTAGGPTAPTITSANAATFTVGSSGSFQVVASGSPASTFSETGALPSGVTLDSATGLLSGTPGAGTAGSYPITITAANGTLPNATQSFTLTVNQAPAITSANSATFKVGTAGTFTVTATGSPTPTFGETGALPSGVTLNSTTGVLSGTPTVGTGGSYPITITATNGVGSDATQPFTLTVGQAPAITSGASTTFVAGTSGTFTVTATGYPAPTFSETGALPTGVSLNSSTGVLSGTPAVGTGGSYPITITATNGVTPDATLPFTLTVSEAPAITSANTTTFTIGTSGTFTVTATGYPAPTFSETGTLPTGVTLDSTTGVLSGTPTITDVAGNYPITLTATNGVGTDATQPFTLVLAATPTAPTITSAGTTTFTAGTAGTFTVTANGNPTPTFGETGALPSGVTFNASTGVLSGTPAAGTGGSYPVTFTATNGNTPDATQNFTLVVDQAPGVTSANATTFTVGTAGTFTVTATGYPAPTFSETGALPSGVSLNSSTGVLSGTPASGTGGLYPITLTATNGVNPDATQSFSLTVTAPPTAPAITSTGSATFTVGTSGSFTVTATGYPIPTFSETGALPTGVSLNATTGVLSGTPAAGTGGSYPLTLTATNGVNPDATQSFVLTVDQAPAITGVSSSAFTVGAAGTMTVTATGYPAPTFSETGTLPTGVTLNATTGVLSGTPAAGTGGSYPITLTATNGVGSDATQPVTLTVDQAPAITSVASTTFSAGTAGTFTVTATGYPAPTFSETGTLPTGVTLNATTGVLSGTPAAGTGGSYPLTLTATNGTSPDATQSFTLTVDQAPAITSGASTTFASGTAGTFTVTATGYPAPTFSETGALPTGVTLDSATGVLSGTPTQTGVFTVTITATNGVTPDATQSFTLTVPGPPAPPTIDQVDTGDGSATVTWTPGPDDGSPITSFTATATPVLGPSAFLLGTLSCTVPAPATSCTITGLVNGTTYVFTVTAANDFGPSSPSTPSAPVVPSANGAIQGYWMVTSAGAVLTNGAAVSYGSAAGLALTKPIVGMTPTPDRKGYWLVASDGGVFAYGDAQFYGSTGGTHLNAPIVGMASTADGQGYWLVAADGGVFAYGDAAFAGSMGGSHLNAPIVGIAGNGNGGYLLVASDGGVFAYGTASFHGSAGAVHLASPVVGITALADGSGYLLAAADGGVFAYGAAPFAGSAAGIAGPAVVGITGGSGGGYTLATTMGGAYAYGTGYYGNQVGTPTTAPIVGIAS